jgi:hypothetical protein
VFADRTEMYYVVSSMHVVFIAFRCSMNMVYTYPSSYMQYIVSLDWQSCFVDLHKAKFAFQIRNGDGNSSVRNEERHVLIDVGRKETLLEIVGVSGRKRVI